MKNLLGMDLSQLVAFCESLGEPRFRAAQLSHWIHQKGLTDFAQMLDLGKTLRNKLAAEAYIGAPAVISQHSAADGTTKWLFDAGAGEAFEAVFIPERNRATLCISSQVGCAVGCSFCATGHQGFSRNLTSAEIIGQLWVIENHLRRAAASSTAATAAVVAPQKNRAQNPAATVPSNGPSNGRIISNVVMMGMGEPLQNYDALIPALHLFHSEHAYGLSRRRITVSTSGMVPMIDRLRVDAPVALAISIHAGSNALRDTLVPLNRKYPLEELMAACQRYLPAAPRDFLTMEYCLIDGVNDGSKHAQELIALLGRMHCKINLIPFNGFSASPYRAPTANAVRIFADQLMHAGFITTIRKTRGDEVDAACGQLAGSVTNRLKTTPILLTTQ